MATRKVSKITEELYNNIISDYDRFMPPSANQTVRSQLKKMLALKYGIHPNTVNNLIRQGSYQAYQDKFVSPIKEKYRADHQGVDPLFPTLKLPEANTAPEGISLDTLNSKLDMLQTTLGRVEIDLLEVKANQSRKWSLR